MAVVWLDPKGHPQGDWSLGPALRGQVELLLALGDAPNPQQSAETDGPTAASPSRTTGSIGSVGLARTGLAAGGWQGTQLELEMTALPKQQQPGWLRL